MICYEKKKKTKNLDEAILFNDNIVFFNEDSDNVPFYSDEIGIPSVGRNDINLDDECFNEEDPEIVTDVILLLDIIDINNAMHVKTVKAKY